MVRMSVLKPLISDFQPNPEAMRAFALLVGIHFASLLAWSQPDSLDQNVPRANLESPYATIETHLKYLQPDTYFPSVSAKTFNLTDQEKAEELAVKLKQVLDAKGLYIDMDLLPKSNNYIDTTNDLARYYLYPNTLPGVFVEKENGKWYWSDRTVERIPILHKEVFPFGSDLLVNLFPSFGQKRIGGLYVWQLIGIFIFIFTILLLHRLLTLLIQLVITRLEVRFAKIKSQGTVIRKIAKPLSLLILTLIVIPFEPMLQLPVNISRYIVLIIQALTPLFLTMAVYRAVDILGEYMVEVAERTENKLDDQLVPLVRKALKVFVIIIGGLVVLQSLDFNITALLAGISIGGIALALAAQDTLKNLFGSLMIFLDRPFQIGDWINFSGVDGTVEEVGFRSTRVRTFANSLVYVPNGKLADMTIDNFGLRQYRRFSTKIALTYDTPTALIQQFVEGLREIVANHPNTRKDYYEIHMNDMNSHSLDVLFYIFFHVPSWSDELKAKHEVILAIIELAENLGVRFAFPTQTLHVEDLPGQTSLSPTYNTDTTTIKERTEAFVKAYKAKYAIEGK